jgi:glycosyltransferase 2 family protein
MAATSSFNRPAIAPSRSSLSRRFVPGKPRVTILVSIVLWAAIAYYFFAVLRHVDWHVVAAQRVNPTLALVVVVIGVTSRFLLPVIWTMALSALEGKAMRVRVLLWPYAQSWMGRYLPGKVGLIGTRLLAAEQYGYSKLNALISGGFEVVLQLILVTVLSLCFLSVGLRSTLPFNALPVAAIAAALAMFISPPILRRVVNVYLRWQKRVEGPIPFLSWGTVLGCVSVLLVMYGLQSTYSIALAEAVNMPVQGRWLVFLGAIYLSSIAGMVAFFSPGGIGVRELVFVQLLGPWYAKEQLLGFVIVWRLAETLMDAIFFLIAWSMRPSRTSGY